MKSFDTDQGKRVFSGLKPSGDLHLGNYLGAVKGWVDSQDEFDNIFCIVDFHAITVQQEPELLKKRVRDFVVILLALGIEPKKSTIFIQSHVPAHTELAWILNCFTPMGWMEKMVQFKEKSEEGRERASVGLFDYPALMAADILLYDTGVVPVGDDQKQHVELARDVAKRFNSIYGKVFKIPEAKLEESGSRIMGLQNPEKKMSKSLAGGDSESNLIYLLDSPDNVRSKIMSATTDSHGEVSFDKERPGIYNLLVIYEKFSGLSRGDIETKFEKGGYANFKKDLAELIIEKLMPIQGRYKEILESGEVEEILEQGAKKARLIAEKKLKEVKNKIGLG